MDNIINKILTITSIEEKAGQSGNFYKLKDQENKTYTLFQTKRDGSETVAYQGFKEKKVGDSIDASFKEEPGNYNGKAYTQRTIINVKSATGVPRSQNINNQVKAVVIQKDDEEKWRTVSFGKCKTLFLVELMKAGAQLEEAEVEAEKWANASMRVLPPTTQNKPNTVVDTFSPQKSQGEGVSEQIRDFYPEEQEVDTNSIPF